MRAAPGGGGGGGSPTPTSFYISQRGLSAYDFLFLDLLLVHTYSFSKPLSSPTTMDPLSLSMAIAPLILTSARLAVLIAVVRDSYTNAPTTLLSTLTECHLMHTALSKIQGLVFRNETELAARLQVQKSLHDAFDKALTGCRITLTALHLEVGKLVDPKEQQGKMKEGLMEMKFCAKVKLIWKENVMRHLLEHTRGLMVSLQFIITLLER